jgi:hypothetical protein
VDRGDVLLTWRFGGAYPVPAVVSPGLPHNERLAVELELDSVFVEPGSSNVGDALNLAKSPVDRSMAERNGNLEASKRTVVVDDWIRLH